MSNAAAFEVVAAPLCFDQWVDKTIRTVHRSSRTTAHHSSLPSDECPSDGPAALHSAAAVFSLERACGHDETLFNAHTLDAAATGNSLVASSAVTADMSFRRRFPCMQQQQQQQQPSPSPCKTADRAAGGVEAPLFSLHALVGAGLGLLGGSLSSVGHSSGMCSLAAIQSTLRVAPVSSSEIHNRSEDAATTSTTASPAAPSSASSVRLRVVPPWTAAEAHAVRQHRSAMSAILLTGGSGGAEKAEGRGRGGHHHQAGKGAANTATSTTQRQQMLRLLATVDLVSGATLTAALGNNSTTTTAIAKAAESSAAGGGGPVITAAGLGFCMCSPARQLWTLLYAAMVDCTPAVAALVLPLLFLEGNDDGHREYPSQQPPNNSHHKQPTTVEASRAVAGVVIAHVVTLFAALDPAGTFHIPPAPTADADAQDSTSSTAKWVDVFAQTTRQLIARLSCLGFCLPFKRPSPVPPASAASAAVAAAAAEAQQLIQFSSTLRTAVDYFCSSSSSSSLSHSSDGSDNSGHAHLRSIHPLSSRGAAESTNETFIDVDALLMEGGEDFSGSGEGDEREKGGGDANTVETSAAQTEKTSELLRLEHVMARQDAAAVAVTAGLLRSGVLSASTAATPLLHHHHHGSSGTGGQQQEGQAARRKGATGAGEGYAVVETNFRVYVFSRHPHFPLEASKSRNANSNSSGPGPHSGGSMMDGPTTTRLFRSSTLLSVVSQFAEHDTTIPYMSRAATQAPDGGENSDDEGVVDADDGACEALSVFRLSLASFSRAFRRGITAAQIINFLNLNGQPQLQASTIASSIAETAAAVPATVPRSVQDQLLMWQESCERIRWHGLPSSSAAASNSNGGGGGSLAAVKQEYDGLDAALTARYAYWRRQAQLQAARIASSRRRMAAKRQRTEEAEEMFGGGGGAESGPIPSAAAAHTAKTEEGTDAATTSATTTAAAEVPRTLPFQLQQWSSAQQGVSSSSSSFSSSSSSIGNGTPVVLLEFPTAQAALEACARLGQEAVSSLLSPTVPPRSGGGIPPRLVVPLVSGNHRIVITMDQYLRHFAPHITTATSTAAED